MTMLKQKITRLEQIDNNIEKYIKAFNEFETSKEKIDCIDNMNINLYELQKIMDTVPARSWTTKFNNYCSGILNKMVKFHAEQKQKKTQEQS